MRKSLEKEERKARKAVMMRRKRHIVFAMVLINVGLLAFLKYYTFSVPISMRWEAIWSLVFSCRR